MASLNAKGVQFNCSDGTRRSSRRIQGLEPLVGADAGTPDMSMPYLPLEIKGHIIKYLNKIDLKTLRHVSKEWSDTATALLFDRIYVSCRSKDIEVFEKITRHPTLRYSIKEMIYDVSNFTRSLRETIFVPCVERSAVSLYTGECIPPSTVPALKSTGLLMPFVVRNLVQT